MKIAINGTSLLHKTKTGVELYIQSLLNELKNLKEQNKHEFYVYYPDIEEDLDSNYIKSFPGNWKFKKIKWRWKYLWTQLAFYKALKKDNIDLLFVPAHVIPFLYKGKAVMTAHDLAFKYFKESYSKKELKYQDLALRSAIKKQAHFIVPSQTTADDLAKFYNLNKKYIHKIYHGFSAQKFEKNSFLLKKIKEKYNIADKYFLTVGRVENKKNTDGMIKAFEILKEKYKGELSFVSVGKASYGYDNIKKIYEKSKYKKDIHLLGYLSTEELSALMGEAYAFLFPSLYEGFGFPILEAMSQNLVVITSNYGVMKEITADAAVLVDPKNYEEIANAMYKLLTDQEYKQNKLEKSAEQYKKFTWEKTARETLDLFNYLENNFYV